MTARDGSARAPGRREFIALGVGAFVVGMGPLGRHLHAGSARRTVPCMGTLAEVVAAHADRRVAQRAIDAALGELARVEGRLTRFRPSSDVGRANLEALRASVPVSGETADVLREALRWAEATEGRFDPCLGRAMALWHPGERRTPPPDFEAGRFAGRRLYRALEVRRTGPTGTVRFHADDLALDLGGIGKGYGVDRAAEALRAHGVTDGLVNVGGDLYALGRSPDGDTWRVGIRSPDDAGRLLATLDVSDRAIATSGDYEQFFEHRGRRYHHLLDPSTGEPRRTAARSITVSAPTCLAADAAATALFGMAPGPAAAALAALAPGGRIELGA